MSAPVSPVDQAAEVAAAAKAAYRNDPNEDTKAAHRAAGAELRYARWVARGGPDAPPAKSTQDLLDRYHAETPGS